MGHREDYQIPDWVVKDYNSRVPKEDQLPLYDGTDSSEYEYSSTETPSCDREMVAFMKALKTGDYTEYNRIKLEKRIIWWGAHGVSKEEVIKMYCDESYPTVMDKIKVAFCKFIIFLLVFLFTMWIAY